MTVVETDRLIIREFVAADDAGFLCRQLNEPSWIANIGDRGVRSIAEAEQYIQARMLASYAEHGFGMYLVERRIGREPIGVCGLVKRETLPDPDLGFALLEGRWGQGYAEEAARAVIGYAFRDLGISRLLGITKPTNQRSGKLLLRLGFKLQGSVRMSDEDLLLYVLVA
jgi:RimJ/RimL family protein N-acetyltransferase